MGKLVLFRPDGTTQDIKLDRDRVTIGRRPDNDVCLPQAAVSGEHAAVVTILDDSFLEDLGSTNGTLVNGKAVTKHFLHDRDEIDVGREILVYLADDSAKAEMPPRRRERRPGAEAADGAASADARRPSGAREGSRPDVPTFSGPSLDAIQRVVAAEIESSAVEEPRRIAPRAAPTAPVLRPAVQAPPPTQAILVRSGAAAGRSIALSETETVFGRAGVQVVALRRSGDTLLAVPIEGAAPRVNGTPVPPDGQRLVVGDILDIAGATLELVPMSDALA